ncbi:N-acetylmuramoyl-L-alanine amidase [Streptomyces sp. NPDC002309]
MPYTGPEFDSSMPRRSRRRAMTVAVAALVPGALLGWAVYEAVGDSGGPGGGRTEAKAPSTAPSFPSPAFPSPAGSPGEDPSSSDGKPAPAPARTGSLQGKVVVVDPGHNPHNFAHTAEINRKVDIGTTRKECDTTGTATNAGYTEAEFTLDLARRLRTLLQEQGATVLLTQNGDRPYGPCIDERARIGNEEKADAVVSLHADGSGTGNRGFHVILPASVHAGAADTRPIVGPSRELGASIAGNFVRATGSAPSNYVGNGTGLVTRQDLGGLNLSTVPKVFIECGNMRDGRDAALLISGAWRQKAAQGVADGITDFLRK